MTIIRGLKTTSVSTGRVQKCAAECGCGWKLTNKWHCRWIDALRRQRRWRSLSSLIFVLLPTSGLLSWVIQFDISSSVFILCLYRFQPILSVSLCLPLCFSLSLCLCRCLSVSLYLSLYPSIVVSLFSFLL